MNLDKILTFGLKNSLLDYHHRESCYAVIIDVTRQQVATIITAKGSFLPGGGIEDNETPEECLQRELLEETGYEAEIGPFLGKAQRYFVSPQNAAILNIGHFFTATFIKKAQAPIEEDHELKWVHLGGTDHLFFHEHHAWAVTRALILLAEKKDCDRNYI